MRLPWSVRSAPPPFGETSGASYAALIEAELKDESTRQASIERRGTALVTTTGVMAGVALAVGPILEKTGTALPAESIAFLAFGAVAFASDVVCGIVANAPAGYDVAEADNLGKLLAETYWKADRAIGSRRAAEVRLAELVSARKANTRKSWWLRVGLALQALGIVFLGAAALIAFELSYRP